MQWMSPEELVAIKARHEHACKPNPDLDGLPNISLVYSGLGRTAHADRGRLLEVVEAIIAKQS